MKPSFSLCILSSLSASVCTGIKNTREQQHSTVRIFINSLKSHILCTHLTALHISISFCRESLTDWASPISNSKALPPACRHVTAPISEIIISDVSRKQLTTQILMLDITTSNQNGPHGVLLFPARWRYNHISLFSIHHILILLKRSNR